MVTRTKIVATIGPERSMFDPDNQLHEKRVSYRQMLPWMVDAGVNVFRLNMSHFSPDGERELRFADSYRTVRYLWESQKKDVAIMGDLQGPKIRIGTFFDDPEGEISLPTGKTDFVLQCGKQVRGDESQVSVLYEDRPFDLPEPVTTGTKIWLGDGEALLEVREVSDEGALTCVVRSGGVIRSRRGVTFKGVAFDLEPFTRKDREDLRFLMSVFGVDLTYVALSFVRNAEDILNFKCYMAAQYRRVFGEDTELARKMPGIIAKIETKQAVAAIDEILDVADGVMVARGDLGMQLDLEELTGAQKRIIHKCNVRGKVVITATQMLDSMERNPIPTRAEVTDVYNAIFDGTDAVMLSGETSKGRYPIQAIETMRTIATEAEVDYFEQTNAEDRFLTLLREAEELLAITQQRVADRIWEYTDAGNLCFANEYRALEHLLQTQQTTDRISHAACNLAIGIESRVIIAPTGSGQTARMVARFRPQCAVVGAAEGQLVALRLSLCFGVHPVNITGGHENNESIFEEACEVSKSILIQRPNGIRQPLVTAGDLIVVTAGYPLNQPGTTNLVKLHKVT